MLCHMQISRASGDGADTTLAFAGDSCTVHQTRPCERTPVTTRLGVVGLIYHSDAPKLSEALLPSVMSTFPIVDHVALPLQHLPFSQQVQRVCAQLHLCSPASRGEIAIDTWTEAVSSADA